MIQNVQLILVSKEENEPDLSVITKHGFAAAVSSSLDKRLLFNALHFVRPVDGDAESIPSLANRYRQKKEEERRGLRVLVAEDNLTNQKVIAKILERAGHRPHLVENGEQALEAMEKEKFDLVLLDLHMPIMGGLETAKIFRFTQRGSSHPPLVALTADTTQESRKACEEAGFDAYLTKPVEVKKLLELLDSLVSTDRKGHGATARGQAPAAGNSASEEGRSEPAIDPAVFNELAALGDEEDFLEKLILIFLETGEQKVADIEKAQRAEKYVLVSELSHALKGSAGQIGASRLMELCNRMSHVSPAVLREEGNETVEVLRKEFERVRAALHEHIRLAGGKGTSYGREGRGEGNSGGNLPHTFRNR
jgi:two-component system sensor histidine kinase RpfC